MKKRFSALASLFLFLSMPYIQGTEPNAPDQEKAGAVATEFINAYIQAIPQFDGYMGAATWVNRSPLASENFKKRLEALYRKALQEDPEFGYGADAVLGAQDFPDAFAVQSVRIDGDRATIELKGTTPFPSILRMILIRDKDSWLVEASGDLIE